MKFGEDRGQRAAALLEIGMGSEVNGGSLMLIELI
jgi:hypothetical protein